MAGALDFLLGLLDLFGRLRPAAAPPHIIKRTTTRMAKERSTIYAAVRIPSSRSRDFRPGASTIRDGLHLGLLRNEWPRHRPPKRLTPSERAKRQRPEGRRERSAVGRGQRRKPARRPRLLPRMPHRRRRMSNDSRRARRSRRSDGSRRRSLLGNRSKPPAYTRSTGQRSSGSKSSNAVRATRSEAGLGSTVPIVRCWCASCARISYRRREGSWRRRSDRRCAFWKSGLIWNDMRWRAPTSRVAKCSSGLFRAA